MKTRNVNKWMLIASLSLVSLVGFTSCDNDDNDDFDNRDYVITGNATSAQVVPAGTATGTATISGTYNPSTRVMSYTSTWTGLTGAPTSAGLFMGTTGTNGTAVGTTWALGAGTTGTGTFTGTTTLSSEEASQLLAGNLYYSYSTTANSAGEVRGQITATR